MKALIAPMRKKPAASKSSHPILLQINFARIILPTEGATESE